MLTADLLADWFHGPLGVWEEQHILKHNNTWFIQDLTMFQEGKTTGLDNTEYLVSAPADASAAAVECWGYVTIDAHDRKRLTSEGWARLNEAVRKRAAQEVAKLEEGALSRSTGLRELRYISDMLTPCFYSRQTPSTNLR